jgi:hypothetical protein
MKNVSLFLILFLISASSFSQATWSAYGGIPNSATRASVIDASNNKWVAMFGGGISKFKPSETFDNYNSINSGMPEDFALCITLDNIGNKWIGTNSSGVVLYNGTTWTVYNTLSGLPGNQINCISVDASNNKWIGVNLNGLTKYNGTTFTTYNTGNSSLPNNNVTCITIDASGNKWIGTYGGLAKFDGTNWTVYTSGNSGLAHDQVYSVVVENSTTIWIGTAGGLNKFNGTSTWTTYNTGNSGLPYNYVNCVTIDQGGMKWIGTTQGGMAKYDGISSWTTFNTTNSNIPGNDVRSISVDNENNLWVCTNGGGFAQYGFPSTDATLSDLQTDGVTVPGFSPSTLNYNVVLPSGTTTVPTTTATTTNNNAFFIINDAFSIPGTTTVTVYAENGISTLNYSINFSISSPNDATLSDLKVDGVTVSGFSPSVYNYNIILPYGTTIPPIVTATTTNSGSTKIITNASSLPGTATVVVTAQDGFTTLTYNINFSIAPPSTDATLSDIKSNGTTVAGFTSGTFNYIVELPYGTTTIPTITATTNNSNATKVITNATSLPGTTTILVTAQDGTTTLTYYINFILDSSSTDATLSDLKSNGTTVAGFNSGTLNYNVILPYGTTLVPTVTATTNDINANLSITNASGLPGTTSVLVTAQDGTTTATYTINYTVATNVNNTYLSIITIYPNPSNGIFNILCTNYSRIIITDITSRIILSKDINPSDNIIDLTGNTPGIYFIRIESGGKFIYKKIELK